MNAAELATRLRGNTHPAVAGFIAWAERRGRGEELRLVQPLVEAGLIELHDDELRLTLPGREAVCELLADSQLERAAKRALRESQA